MIINRQMIKCDVKDCGQEYPVSENIAWGTKPSFIHLPPEWRNFISYCCSFYVCPKHEIIVKIDGEDLE